MTESKFLSGATLVAGVMGWPVSHSKSPRLHGYWLKQFGIDGIYIPMPVAKGQIGAALKALPVLGMKGCNITIPHKEEAMAYVDEVDALAKRVGAINTVVVQKEGKLKGLNTDVFGFMENMKQAGYEYNKELPCATVLGAGGAARAVVVGLQEFGYKKIRIVNRKPARAEELAKSIKGETTFEIFSLDDVAKALDGSGMLVNATSLGMEGHPPLAIEIDDLPKEAWVMDAVYTPLETELLALTRQKHRRAVDGLGMLLHQARAGFALWFGKDPAVTKELRALMLEL